jgi:hypothetical protein
LDSSSVTTASNAGLGLCAGKKILVKTLDNSNNVLWSCDVLIGTYVSSVPATAVAGACPSTTTVASAGSGTNKGFSIRNATGTAIAAADVYKITLESHN